MSAVAVSPAAWPRPGVHGDREECGLGACPWNATPVRHAPSRGLTLVLLLLHQPTFLPGPRHGRSALQL